MAMEQRILALSQENHLLKSRLESRTAAESLLQTTRPDLASFPPQASTPLFTHLPTSSVGLSSLAVPPLSSLHSAVPNLSLPHVPLLSSTSQLPIMQLCQLQAAIQHQYRGTPSSSSVFSVGSAFQPFQTHKDSVIMKAERISPDSSSDRVERVIQRVPSSQNKQERAPSQSLLGALLASRRTSPAVPQSRTEHHSRLGSPPKFSPSKSDCESISSSASLSPHSSEDHPEASAIRRALDGNIAEDKKEQYMDRRRRNNEAAKRCRANRRAVFEYRSRRVQLLESENDQLKEEIAKLKREVDQFKSLITAQNIMDTQ